MSLRLKTILGIALIEALLLAFLIFTTVSHMQDSAGRALLKRAHTTATLFASTAKDPVLSYDLASLKSFSTDLLTNPDLEYVRVLDPQGRIFSSAGDKSNLEKEFKPDSSLDDVDDDVLDYTVPIEEGGISYGKVELGININGLQREIAENGNLSTLIATVEMALVALFSFLLGTYLTRQLKVLEISAKNISEGDYTLKVPVTGNDEVAKVAQAFNHMTAALQESEIARSGINAELIEVNKTLEERVVHRTKRIEQQVLELRDANHKIQETQEKLSQSEKLASIGQLAAGVAHEINNPIGFVHGNLEALSEYIKTYQDLHELYRTVRTGDVDAAEAYKTIEAIESAEDIEFIKEDLVILLADSIEGTTRVRDIVQGLNTFSHNEKKGKSACNINECILSTLKLTNNELKHKCNVVTELDEIPEVEANKGEIKQVLMNLLVNAGHAVEARGQITVKTSVCDQGVKITVTDNGKGIKTEDMGKLFDPFFTTKAVGEGTGLGLSISFGIVQDHGGEITVESEVGTGTTFAITLPSIGNQLALAA